MFFRIYLSPDKIGTSATCNYKFKLLSVHQVPITTGWPEAVWNAKFAWHFYTRPALGIEPQAFWSWVQCPVHLATSSPADTCYCCTGDCHNWWRPSNQTLCKKPTSHQVSAFFQVITTMLTTGTDDPSLTCTRAIIKVSAHQYQWLPGGYDQ